MLDSQDYAQEKEAHTYTDEPKTLPLLGIGLAVLLASATFFSGLHIGTETKLEASIFSFFSSKTVADDSVDLSEFWDVWQLLDEKFVTAGTSTTVTEEEKIQGAIDGLVRSYDDPYTIYLPPADASMFEEDISGNFSGVGMEVGIRDGVVTVIAPLPDSPAEQAGLLAGDAVVRVDSKSTEGMGIDEAVRLIRGEKGTDVTLTIYREGEGEFRDIVVTRDTITIPTIKTELFGDTFVISLYSFNAIAEAQMQEALREYVASGATNMVLDLRGNPGGYLQSAVSIASYFLPMGKTVVRESFGDSDEEEVYRSSGKTLGRFTPEKLVVLVDGGSASASEILAGALKEHGVATVIGAQTFGKGSVQELVELDDGSSLKVTVARWLHQTVLQFQRAGLHLILKLSLHLKIEKLRETHSLMQHFHLLRERRLQ